MCYDYNDEITVSAKNYYEDQDKIKALNEFFELSQKNPKLDQNVKAVLLQLKTLWNNTPNEKFNLIGMNEILKNQFDEILKNLGVKNE